MRTRPALVALLAVAVLGVWLAAARPTRAAPTITSYTDPTMHSPTHIAAGPDGALWFTNGSANAIGRITTTGLVTTYPSALISGADHIAAGPDGAMWFTNYSSNSIGRITTDGSVARYTSTSINGPKAIAAGPDGAMWFINYNTQTIGRITVAGVVTSFAGPSAGGLPQDIAAGPDGALWFTVGGSNDSVERITTSGVITPFYNPAISSPQEIAAGPDGALWFAITGYGGSIGRLTTTGVFTQFSGGSPWPIAEGPDGAMWFTNAYDSIGRITTTGAVTKYTDSTVLSPLDITAGPDGAMWFTNNRGNSIGRITVPSTTDTSAPVITVPPSFSVDATAPTGAPVTYTVSASDDVDGAIVPTCTPPSGSAFPIGATTVVCAASDFSGHTSTASFSVTVQGAYNQLGTLYAKVIAVKGQKDIADKLHHAQQEVTAGHAAPACKDLSSFISTVRTRSGKAIPSATASQWIADATRIGAVIGC